MAILKFRVSLEDNSTIFRDICLSHKDHFLEFHKTILEAFGFDNKHAATFYKSNEYWEKGKLISLEDYKIQPPNVPMILMENAFFKTEIKNPHQRYIYHYDFTRNWIFLIELIEVLTEQSTYNKINFKSGANPSQYDLQDILKTEFEKMDERYNLSNSKKNSLDDEETDITGLEEELNDLDEDKNIDNSDTENDNNLED